VQDQCPLALGSGRDRIPGLLEGEVEAVALHLDLDSTVALERIA
jgi:hypothetical protein